MVETPIYLYISSGEKSVFFTLKLYFKFESRGKTFFSSRFIKSLSVDLTEATLKAENIAKRYGLPLKKPSQGSAWRMKSHGARTKVYGNTVMSFGKYKGMQLKDILKKDPKYCHWLCKNSENPSSEVFKIVSFLRSALKEKPNQKPVDREKLKLAWYSRSQHIGVIGESLTILARVNKCWQTETKWGTQCVVVLETQQGNHIKIKSRSKDAFKLHEDEWYQINGTVAEHSKYKYILQTIINRVTILRSLDHKESALVEKERQKLIDNAWANLSQNLE